MFPTFFRSPTHPILAVGGHYKNTIAIALENQIFLSQHIGDLANPETFAAFKETISSLSNIYDFQPQVVACDLHPDYLSSQFAQQLNLPVIRVQHHYAHVLSCMADNNLKAPVLGVAWDGTGYGLDGTIWGGEFIYVTADSWQRVAHLRTFRLPGGEKAIAEPRRVALGLLYEIFGDEVFTMTHLAPLQAFSVQELAILQTMLQKSINTPITSSIGRLFDAIASILGIRQRVTFEGQAAMELEFSLKNTSSTQYPGKIKDQTSIPLEIDFAPMILAILEDIKDNLPKELIAAKFHQTLVAVIVDIAHTLSQLGLNFDRQIALTGGCFQNQYLTEHAINRLLSENFFPYWHQNVPPNDGGIALGQIIGARRTIAQNY